MPGQLRITQAFPEMPDFQKCLPHNYCEAVNSLCFNLKIEG